MVRILFPPAKSQLRTQFQALRAVGIETSGYPGRSCPLASRMASIILAAAPRASDRPPKRPIERDDQRDWSSRMLNWSGANRLFILVLGTLLATGVPATAAMRCERLLSRLAEQLADAKCVESPNLTTANPDTTPADNSLPSLPTGAFTPTTDRAVISPGPPNRTPTTKTVPGIQAQRADGR
jgi:hypothetical protein